VSLSFDEALEAFVDCAWVRADLLIGCWWGEEVSSRGGQQDDREIIVEIRVSKPEDTGVEWVEERFDGDGWVVEGGAMYVHEVEGFFLECE